MPSNTRYEVKEREYRFTATLGTWPYHEVIKSKTRPDPAFVLNRPNIREYPKCKKAE